MIVKVGYFVLILCGVCLACILPPKSPGEECPKPKFATDFKATQLVGTWHIQRILNAKDKFDMNCTNVEYASRMDNLTSFKSMTYFETKTNKFVEVLYEVYNLLSNVLVLQILQDKTLTYKVHIGMHGNDAFIEHFCFYKNDIFQFQGLAIFTRDRIVSKEKLDEVQKVITDNEIKITDTYIVQQHTDCFKYNETAK